MPRCAKRSQEDWTEWPLSGITWLREAILDNQYPRSSRGLLIYDDELRLISSCRSLRGRYEVGSEPDPQTQLSLGVLCLYTIPR